MNMVVGVRLKTAPNGLPQLLELRLLKHSHIGDRFRSARFRSSCLQNICKLRRKRKAAGSFFSDTAKNSQNSYFSKRVMHVSLPFGLSATYTCLQGYVSNCLEEEMSRTDTAYLSSS